MSTFSLPGAEPRTFLELLRTGERSDVGHPVLLDRSGASMDWAALAAAMSEVGGTLQAESIGREDRVALAFPPGPQAAAALLGTMTQAVAAPLNPQAPESAHRDDLRRLGVSLVLTDRQPPPALIAAAADLGLRVHRLSALPSTAAGVMSPQLPLPPPRPSDLALLLQTSGTTSRPKVVPLSHANLLASAANVAAVLDLRPADRSLAVMPLFHIHGIVASLLAPLLSGGSAICSEPLPGAELLELIRGSQATWMSAVPTLLQDLVKACGAEGSSPPVHTLRFIRSSSAPLAPALAQRLETLFDVPVIEAYGMTEAAHQIASNRLPPVQRMAGSVGFAAGPEVAVLGANHQPLPVGELGEVAIRGANVTVGYLQAAENGWVANPDGSRWFLTGDEGSLDHDGVLRLTGRLKEMINRGGEKVIPREVDEVLGEHPSVEQALCFAVPHPTLGEDVVAAVVLKTGLHASEDELRAHCLTSLLPHQVPSRILMVDGLPKGPTGKLQRIGLAERLSNLLAPPEEPLEGEVEELVGEIFAAVLDVALPSRDSNFFALGGDSLTGQLVISRLNSQLPLDLPAALLFRCPTPRILAAELEERIDRALASLEGAHGP